MSDNINDNEDLKKQLIALDKNREGSDEASPLGRVETTADKKTQQNNENIAKSNELGYRAMKMDVLPSKGNFYPSDCNLMFRACNVDEIKFFSTMIDAEQDGGDDLQVKIGYILTKCVKMSYGGSPKSAADYLKDADKICMMFTIRDLTMDAHGRENKLMNEVQCRCGKHHKFELTNNTLSYYEFPDDIWKYYDSNERCFILDDSAISKEGSIRLYIPSIATNSIIMKFMKDKETGKRRGESTYFNIRHLTILSFIVKDHTEITPQRLANIGIEIDTWSDDKFEVINYAIDMLNFNIKPTISIPCKKSEGGCGEVVTTPVIFRKGWRHFYDISNLVGKLFPNSKQTVGS